jgi:hypothetical protein
MVRDYAAIPVTSAPAERIFNIAGNLISKNRTNIASENVRYILCLRNWAYLVEDDDQDELVVDENGQIIEPPDGPIGVQHQRN